ncbi:MAG: O-antigen ligase family protein [Patescibacteria group bacterium]|jgi:O-antigen ligase
MNKLENWLNLALGLYLGLLPWQTRLILDNSAIHAEFSEYAALSLYATDLLLLAVFILSLFLPGIYQAGQKQIKIGILALIVVILGSVIFADKVEVAIFSIKILAIGLMLYLLLQQKWVNQKFLLICFLGGGILQAVIGITQFLSQTSPAVSWLGLSVHDPAIAGTSVVEAGGMRWLRAYGSLPHPNILGGYLALCLLTAFGFYLKIYEKARAGFSKWTRENVKRHIEGRKWYINQAWKISGLVVGGAILTLGLLLSFSRSAWLSFTAVWLIILCILIIKKIPGGWVLWCKWSIFMGVMAITMVAFLPQPFFTRVSMDSRLESKSLITRSSLYQDAWTLIKKEPIRGVGYGNMVMAVYNQVDASRGSVHDYQPVHNIYVLSAVELGLLGGVIFLIFLVIILKTAIFKLLKTPSPVSIVAFGMFVCLVLIGLFDHYLWTLSAGVGLLWLVVGLISKEEA